MASRSFSVECTVEDALRSDVPYGLDVPRWTDPQPLPDDYDYGGREYTKDALYCAQPTRFYTQHGTY